jgi:hypothetical protein
MSLILYILKSCFSFTPKNYSDAQQLTEQANSSFFSGEQKTIHFPLQVMGPQRTCNFGIGFLRRLLQPRFEIGPRNQQARNDS